MAKRREAETPFRRRVIQYAKLRGWLVHHCRPGLYRSGRWATHIEGDAGFPDLVLSRLSRLVFAELKGSYDKPTASQALWLSTLEISGKVEVYVWKPDDEEKVWQILA